MPAGLNSSWSKIEERLFEKGCFDHTDRQTDGKHYGQGPEDYTMHDNSAMEDERDGAALTLTTGLPYTWYMTNEIKTRKILHTQQAYQ